MNRRHVALALLLTIAAVAGVAVASNHFTTAETSGTVPLGATGGPTVGVSCDCRADMVGMAINASAAQIRTEAGNITIDGTDGAYARGDNLVGDWTNVSNVETNGGHIDLSPEDKPLATISGGLTALDWRPAADTALDDGTVDFSYSAGSSSSVSLAGLPADTQVAAIPNDSPFEILDSATTDASGRVTFDGLDGSHDVRIRKKPGTLSIRNESDPSSLVDNATVEIRFYLGDDTDAPDQIVTRQASDGTINMTGLPADESFVVVAEADGYLPRRIYVPSLYQQERIYLLPESQRHVEKVYSITDYTGLYPSEETVLIIERALGTSWETVQADFLGATGGFEAQLRYNTRHRLTILNTVSGDTRRLGRVTPLASGAEEVEVNTRSDIELSRIGPLVSLQPQVRTVAATQTDITVEVAELSSTLEAWNYTVRLENASGSFVLAQDQFSSPGEATANVDLTNQSNGTLVVETGWRTADGRESLSTSRFAIERHFQNENSLLAVLGNWQSALPAGNAEGFTTIVAMFSSVFVAAAVSRKVRLSTEGVGLVAVGVLAIWSIIGWVSYAIVFATGVAWTAMTAVRRGL